MLKKNNRGLKRKDFEKSLAQGKLVQSPLFAVSVVKSEEPQNQYGFIVSKKLSKLAVKRNRARRLLAEAIRENAKVWGEQKYKLIFLARRTLMDKKYNEVEVEVRRVLEKITK